MNGWIAFTKKEFMEQLRSYKALILIAVLFLFGMASPLLAKMMPVIFSQMSVQGISITIPKPTLLDAWGQFFKNMRQMGIIVVLLVFSGTLSQEVTKNTLILPISKGLSRNAVILSKYFASIISWTFSYALAGVTACGYTFYLFGRFSAPHLLFSLFCLWLFGAFLLAIMMLAGTVASGNYGGLLLTAAILAIMLAVDAFPRINKWNPLTLASDNSSLLLNAITVGDLSATIWTTFSLTALCLILSLILFQKKKL